MTERAEELSEGTTRVQGEPRCRRPRRKHRPDADVGVRPAWLSVLALLLSGCVAQANHGTRPVPQFPHLYIGTSRFYV